MPRDYEKELRESTRYNRRRGYKKTDYDNNTDRWITLAIIIILIALFGLFIK